MRIYNLLNSNIIFYILTFLHLALPGPAQAQDTPIIVHYHERPPYYVTVNGTLGGVIGKRVAAAFKAAGIPHQFHRTPPRRQLLILQENSGRDCMVGWFKTPERTRYAIYSRPIFQDRPQMVLARRDHPLFEELPSISELLANRSARLLLKEGYSYGQALDDMISMAMPRITLSSADAGSMIHMVHAGRADYMFLSALEAEALLHNSGVDGSDLFAVTLAGTPRGSKRYLLFSKQVEEEMVKRINKAIVTLFPPQHGK